MWVQGLAGQRDREKSDAKHDSSFVKKYWI